MSLQSVEARRDIDFGTPLFAASNHDIGYIEAIDLGTFERIPESVRQHGHSKPGSRDVDIYVGISSGPTSAGSYTISDFRIGPFLFSLTRENAEQYLPLFCKRYDQGR